MFGIEGVHAFFIPARILYDLFGAILSGLDAQCQPMLGTRLSGERADMFAVQLAALSSKHVSAQSVSLFPFDNVRLVSDTPLLAHLSAGVFGGAHLGGAGSETSISAACAIASAYLLYWPAAILLPLNSAVSC